MPKCSFCSKNVNYGSGKMVVETNGKILWFCSSKCEKNANLGRDPRDFKWVKEKK